MRHLARKDLFYIEFTKKFIPEKIEEFYKPYVKNMPTQLESPRTLVESSLQGVTIPSYQYEGVEQGFVDTLNKNEIKTTWRSTLNAQELTEKNLTLTFKLLNGYVNYWILLDTFFFHYDMKNPEAFIGDITLRMLDNQENVMFSRVYRDCILTGISDFELSYSENIQTFETFNITLQYSKVESTFANPGNPNTFDTNPSKLTGKISDIKIQSEQPSQEQESEPEPEPDPLLLDSLSGSTGAFSLRKLNSSYTGNAVQVRRSSDDTTQDIGFVNNQLDIASLNTFCSGTDGFVSIWYNQSDVNNNAIQTTSNNQPKIYDSTTGVELENGKPTLTFNTTVYGTRHLFVNDVNFGNINQILSTFVVHKSTNAGTQMITSKGYLGDSEHMIYLKSAKYKTVFETDIISTVDSAINSQYSMAIFASTGLNGFNQFKNGFSINQSTLTADLTGINPYKYGIGYNTNTQGWGYIGNIQELITFDNDLINHRVTIENNINTNYTIY
tara:strand:- start:151 stop:1644 length:1494 start_codon:yes stop_codon:yes gene_type:complete